MWKYPLFDLRFNEEEADAVQKVVSSGWLTMGEVTREFERAFAKYVGVEHAVAVSSCTTALHLANRVLGVGPGDEVICPSLTFVGAVNTIVYNGAKPVFADVEGCDDFSVSVDDIESKITDKTKAIQVMHYGGYPCNMGAIATLARRRGLKIIEDAAHAPGAWYGDRMCGNVGDIGCFSFFSNKNISTGEGGMITTNDGSLADRIRIMRCHGMTTQTLDRHKGHAFEYDVVELGYNYRIDEIRAAIGLVQLEKLDKNNDRRRNLVTHYKGMLADIPGISVPYMKRDEGISGHLMPILLRDGSRRQTFMEAMKSHGVQTSIHYPIVSGFDYYRRCTAASSDSTPIAKDVAAREVTLPLHPGMNVSDVEYICEAVRKFFKAGGDL